MSGESPNYGGGESPGGESPRDRARGPDRSPPWPGHRQPASPYYPDRRRPGGHGGGAGHGESPRDGGESPV